MPFNRGIIGKYANTSSRTGLVTAKEQFILAAGGFYPRFVPSEATSTISHLVSLLIKTDGSNGGDNTSIVDSSTNAYSITVNGNSQASTFSPYRSGGYSFLLTSPITVSGDANLAFGTSNFTVEAWVFLLGATTIYDGRPSSTNGNYFRLSASTTNWQVYINGATRIDTTTNYSQNEWHHVVYSRTGGTGTLYIDGQSVGTYLDSTNYLNGSSRPIIGASGYSGSTDANAYIRDLRVVNGTAVYTSTFTPPTEALTAITNTDLLICHLPYIADGSTNEYTFTSDGSTAPFGPYDYEPWTADDVGGSVYLDGNGDYLTVADTAARLGGSASDSWTIECWVYLEGLPSTRAKHAPLWVQYSTSASNRSQFYINKQENKLLFWVAADGTTQHETALTAGSWYHIAMVKSGNSVTLYLNGKGETDSIVYDAGLYQENPTIGAVTENGDYLEGYIADYVMTKGTAKYSADFTPPTSPVSTGSADLHIKGNESAIYDATGFSHLVLNGNATTSTAVTKYATSSVAFDGDGDYILVSDGDNIANFGSDDFTVEFWLNLSSTIGRHTPIGWRSGSGATNTNWLFWYDGGIEFYASTGSSWIADGLGGQSLSTGQWYHIAVTRSANIFTMWVDGSSAGTVSSASAISSTSRPLYVGYDPANAAHALNGYIEDLRITKGLALYTTSFTPPTAALT